jgi:hypothetical protein
MWLGRGLRPFDLFRILLCENIGNLGPRLGDLHQLTDKISFSTRHGAGILTGLGHKTQSGDPYGGPGHKTRSMGSMTDMTQGSLQE